jgi:hypothetical protein
MNYTALLWFEVVQPWLTLCSVEKEEDNEKNQ